MSQSIDPTRPLHPIHQGFTKTLHLPRFAEPQRPRHREENGNARENHEDGVQGVQQGHVAREVAGVEATISRKTEPSALTGSPSALTCK